MMPDTTIPWEFERITLAQPDWQPEASVTYPGYLCDVERDRKGRPDLQPVLRWRRHAFSREELQPWTNGPVPGVDRG